MINSRSLWKRVGENIKKERSMRKYQIGDRVTVTTRTPTTRQFNGVRRVRNYFYDPVSEHVWYGLANGKDYRSDWLERA